MQEEEALTMVLYSRADTWLGWGETREADKPLTSLARIVKLAFTGFEQTVRAMTKQEKSNPEGKLATSIVPILLLTILFSAGSIWAQVNPTLSTQLPRQATATLPATGATTPHPAPSTPSSPSPISE